jgi:hypothetical protein
VASFYSRVLHRSNAGLCEVGESEVTNRRGGRAGWSARARGVGTAQRCAEAEHARGAEAHVRATPS